MTVHQFAVGVLQWLLIFTAIMGVALCFESIFERRPKRSRYWMPTDYEDSKRRIQRNGFKSRIGVR